MTKKRIIGLTVGLIALIIAVAFIILWLVGVFDDNYENTYKANELYTELNSSPNKIEVEMDDEHVGNFTVEEADKIEQIYTLVTSLNYRYSKGAIPPGSNIYLKFIYPDDKVIYFTSRSITLNGRQYLAEAYRELDDLLITMGIDGGFISER